jgi:hypothetical protein
MQIKILREKMMLLSICQAIKYLKDNKAAASDPISAELLKSGGPSLMNALNEMTYQVWIDETLPESWIEEVLRPVYKKGKNYCCICLLKVLHSRLLPYAKAVVQHYQAGFQSGNSTTDQLFALRQILEKRNEFNIKAAYDTITRNEIYLITAELNFSTKLIRLTKATLTTVKCCVKI